MLTCCRGSTLAHCGRGGIMLLMCCRGSTLVCCGCGCGTVGRETTTISTLGGFSPMGHKLAPHLKFINSERNCHNFSFLSCKNSKEKSWVRSLMIFFLHLIVSFLHARLLPLFPYCFSFDFVCQECGRPRSSLFDSL